MIRLFYLISLMNIYLLTFSSFAMGELKDPQAVGDREALSNHVTNGLPKTSVIEDMGVDQLPIPSEKDILEGFGAYFDKPSKKFVFRSSDLDSSPAKYFLPSLFPVPGVSPEQMQGLVDSAPCGKRGFETIVSYRKQSLEEKNSKAHHRVGLIWSCSRGCLGVIEKTRSDENGLKTVVAMSTLVGIPEEFCSAIWGGIIKIEDKSTERFIR